MELCSLLRIFSIACAVFFVLHVILMLVFMKSQNVGKMISETNQSAKWLRVTVFLAPLLLMLYWMFSYSNVQRTVLEALSWFVIFDFVLLIFMFLFRLIGVFTLKDANSAPFKEMMGKTASFMTVGMLLTVIIHFFLQGVRA